MPSPERANVTPTAKQQQLDAYRVDPDGAVMTTNQGLAVSDDDNSLKVGERGPTLLEDFHFREKMTHFDHERIPERVVHARGAGAHGRFTAYGGVLDGVTSARFLTDPARETSVFVRFSTVGGSRGSADTVRDVRGFATKFYTEEGVFDLVGNNMPVFFIQDAIKFPDFVHAVKPEPHNEIPQASSAHDTFWDFVSTQTEAMHIVMWLMSDIAIPRSYRLMNGFGVHTFRLVNDAGEGTFVKFHWRPTLGAHSLVWDEAQKLAGRDPDFNRRDLWESIEGGSFPEWELSVQLVPEADEDSFDFDLLDPTKLIPEERVPLQPVGKMVLDRNPDNFFAETEQVAFHLGHVVPGIDFTNDPLLQGRLFSYTDTQLIRLGGPNFAQLPINKPINPVVNNQREGYGQTMVPIGRQAYSKGSFPSAQVASPEQGGYVSYQERVDGVKIRKRSESFADHFSQATMFVNSLSPWEREHLVDACKFELSRVAYKPIRERVVACFEQIDHDLAVQVAAAVGVPAPAGGGSTVTSASPALSLASSPRTSIATRKVAVLAADGVDGAAVTAVKDVLTGEGALVDVVGVHAGELATADGGVLQADQALFSSSSVLYDAVLVPGGAASVAALSALADAVVFVGEAYKHGKAIAAVGEGVSLVERVLSTQAEVSDGALVIDKGVVTDTRGDAGPVAAAFVEAIKAHRDFTRADKTVPA